MCPSLLPASEANQVQPRDVHTDKRLQSPIALHRVQDIQGACGGESKMRLLPRTPSHIFHQSSSLVVGTLTPPSPRSSSTPTLCQPLAATHRAPACLLWCSISRPLLHLWSFGPPHITILSLHCTLAAAPLVCASPPLAARRAPPTLFSVSPLASYCIHMNGACIPTHFEFAMFGGCSVF